MEKITILADIFSGRFTGREFVSDFSLSFSTEVDGDLDGYSDDYASMQLDLYREVSGRGIDQRSNEMLEIDVAKLARTANPYGSVDPDIIANHARTILNSIVVSGLPPDATVLDMGCGWGISTEMFGFCGCRVTAVDINPLFVDLVAQRAASRGYDVTTREDAFDTFESDEKFDLVFFYESLHHAISPWEVIARVGPYVKQAGKFTIAGEPIQQKWWTSWGLRLDPQSVYCVRKFGWFENGWSEEFISDCFRRSGFELTLLPGIGILHSPIGVAVRPEDGLELPTAHWVVPVAPHQSDPPRSLARRLASRARHGLS